MKPILLFTYTFFLTGLAGLTGLAASAQQDASRNFNQVITQYLAVKDALAASDGNLALTHAKVLLTAVKSVNAGSLPDAERKTWVAFEPKLEYDSRHISEVNRIEHQREHFTSLSANLYSVLRVIKLNEVMLYALTCTMTNKTFLSQTATGKDPYMGMANCSKVTATLPANHLTPKP